MNSQEYIEVAIKITPYSDENAEILTAEISELPFESFTAEDPYLKCYVQKELYNQQALKVVLDGISDYGFDVEFSSNLMPAVNWNALWESQFTPIIVDGKCTIKASFHEGLKRTRFNITIDPKMAFGTGHHQTTFMMCRALLQNEEAVRGKVVMDMGCGTAILAILAAKMKASQVENPRSVQTGPAVRGDRATAERHIKMLEKSPHVQEIYRLMNDYIFSNKN